MECQNHHSMVVTVVNESNHAIIDNLDNPIGTYLSKGYTLSLILY